jgi:Heterokaryon incompatibility protein (HET)
MLKPTLYKDQPDGFRELTVPPYEYQPLNHDAQEQRFLTLHPSTEDTSRKSNHVKCSIEIRALPIVGPFIAVKNSRGYRIMQEAIEVDGKALLISAALELFLRHFRRTDRPVTLWIRHICLIEMNKDEQARYWNRTFIDSIYDRASEVVNMSIFNNNLLDKGVIYPICDSRYSTWTKEWYGTPERAPLPRVFPLRLGQRCSAVNPTDEFAYVPLDMVTNETRILIIQSSADPMAPTTLALAHCPVKCEVVFHALSYTWGTLQTTTDIVVNGQILTITQSLEQILRAIRRPAADVAIWIDAICINQSDVIERNCIVPRIATVYDSAIGVICYLGPFDDSANEALDFVQYLQEPKMSRSSLGTWDIGGDEKIGPEAYLSLCAALYKLLTRPYFRRVWILQEVAYASNPLIGCGHRFDIRFDQLEKAASNLSDMLRRDPTLADQMKSAAPGMTTVSEAELLYVRKLSYFRHLISRGHSNLSILSEFGDHTRIGKHSPGMLETAILARDFQATDGHDKIFALWDLAQDKDGIDFKMDYSDSVSKSFTKFAVAWAMQHKGLDIIGAVCHDGKRAEFYDTAPSWCPDWTTPAGVSCLVRTEGIPMRPIFTSDDPDRALYGADGGMKNDDLEHPFFGFDGSSLLCNGIIVDQIQAVFADPSMSADKEIWESHYVKFSAYIHGVTDFYAQSKDCPYEDPRRAAWSMLHGDVPSAWLRREESQNRDDAYPDEEYVCDYERSRYIQRWGSSYSRMDSWDAVRSTLRGRSLAFSDKGYMCLVPQCVITKESLGGWLLAILATCSVPILLQRLEDGAYRVAGSCFVQGWMEGEVLIDPSGAGDPKAFWAARQDDEKLRIV